MPADRTDPRHPEDALPALHAHDEDGLSAASALLDAVPAESLLLSTDGTPLLANEALAQRLGERGLWALLFEDVDTDEQLAPASLVELANLDGTFVRELRLVGDDGLPTSVVTRLLPVRAHGDFPGGWLVSLRPLEVTGAEDELQSLRRCRAALVEALRHEAGGEVVVRSGDVVGRVFVHRGQIAWAYSTAMNGTLLQALLDEGLDTDEVRAIFEQCRTSGANFGEELVRLGLIPRVRLRELLRLHVRQRLRAIVTLPDASVVFAPADRVYQGDLTFSLRELLE